MSTELLPTIIRKKYETQEWKQIRPNWQNGLMIFLRGKRMEGKAVFNVSMLTIDMAELTYK